MTKTKKLTTCAMLIAFAVVLTLLSKLIPSLPSGGSVTIASMVPIIVISIIFDVKWGLLSGFVFSLLQMMPVFGGFYPPPTQTFFNFFLVVMLDYIIAYGVLGLAGLFYKLFGKKLWAIPLSGLIVTGLRYVCHIMSGILIWGVYAENQTVLMYSLTYNGSYMIPEMIITTVTLGIISKFILNQAKKFD